MTMREFDGKTAIVTGAASGLGRATAYALTDAGANLVIADIDVSGLEATAAHIRSLGAKPVSVELDICDAVACGGLVERAVSIFGRLDALCNVAGAVKFAHAADIRPETWDRIFAVNVRGPFFLIQAALPQLIANAGAVVNVASASAFLGHAYLAPYAASKAALVNLTKSLAMEFIHSPVRINAIAPGGINTPMSINPPIPEGVDFQLISRYTPLRGLTETSELTDLILMLAGPRGAAIHGACLNADRGTTAG